MSYYNYNRTSITGFPLIFPSGVKILIIINIIVFIIQMFSGRFMINFFGHNPISIEKYFFIWQIFTYQFLHGDLTHIIFNMLALWMFGSGLENLWGKKLFLKFYLICGTGSGIIIYLLPKIFGQPSAITIGASGAVFGILLAYAVLWPDRQILFMLFFPIKIKYFVIIIGAISLFFTLSTNLGSKVSHVGHLGGFITAYFYLIYQQRRNINMHIPSSSFLFKINLWKRFQEYRRKRKWEQDKKIAKMHMNAEEKINEILEKINREGINSLSQEESIFLKQFSEKLKKHDS